MCKQSFTSIESYKEHRESKLKVECEVCLRKTFFNQDCFDRHLKVNCQPQIGINTYPCLLCNRRVQNSLDAPEHVCDFGYCDHCGTPETKFQSREEKRDHFCYMKELDKFWEPVTNAGGRTVWKSHWFYDFETTRGQQITDSIDRVSYIHEVMAWSFRLMIPCDETARYIKSENVIQEMIDVLDKLPPVVRSDISYLKIKTSANVETIRFWGRELTSFLSVCENVIYRNAAQIWKPVLWAHNGSKFDSKFILDHYLNVEKLQLYAPSFESVNVPKRPEEGEEEVETVHSKFNWRKKNHSRRVKNTVQVSMIGSKILQLRARGVEYRCSHAHHAMGLRNLPKTFNLDIDVKKGEFPYPLLKRENFGRVFPTFPELELFNIRAMPKDRHDEVLAWHQSQPQNEPWDFDKELWAYLFADVDVGCAAMEAYHMKSEEMHVEVWKKNMDKLDKHCSPLDSLTSPSWALKMYRTWFMPPETLVILKKNAYTMIRSSLRGGRTDKRANWIKMTPERKEKGDKIVYVDFKSLYPSVQKCDVHDTHYPVGNPVWGRFKGPSSNAKLINDMGDKTGFVTISCVPLKYVTHPTLHRVGSYDPMDASKKLLFENDPKDYETYGWPEIQEAIRCGEIEVTYVHDACLFEKGTNVFGDYVNFFFEVKDQAEVDGNAGLRALAKLLLNSLWGKLGQRSYPITEWVEDCSRRDHLMHEFEKGKLELVSCVLKDDKRAFFQYRDVEDLPNMANTAAQVAAFVSMWGRVILHKKILSVHGMRALYCDTDSAIVYLRNNGVSRDEITLGSNLGDLTDEVGKKAKGNVKRNNPYISEYIGVVPKTYAFRIQCDLPGVFQDEVVCKGFESSVENTENVNFKSFKELEFTQYNLNAFCNGKRDLEEDVVSRRVFINTAPRLRFGSSLNTDAPLCPTESYVKKSICGVYTKGQKHPYDPRFIAPFSRTSKLLPSLPGSFMDDLDNLVHFE